jgi:hypothetical protein
MKSSEKNKVTEYELLLRRLNNISGSPANPDRGYRPIADYANLAHDLHWRQHWDCTSRVLRNEFVEYNGRVWSDALETALHENDAVWIGKMEEPLYLDRPIILASGKTLKIHPATELRLIPGSSPTPMIINSAYASEHGRDRVIRIEGGIWNAMYNEGRGRINTGGCGPSGCFTILHAEQVSIVNIKICDMAGYGIQIADVSNFRVDNIRFDRTADGVHVDGPAACGVIRNIAGHTEDDLVALTAWDWIEGSLTFGPIREILVEDVEMERGETWAEMRLLPGIKRFPDDSTIDCPIDDCIVRDIRHVHTFKMYEQPSWYDTSDRSDGSGDFGRVYFRDIQASPIPHDRYYDHSSDTLFDICCNAKMISIRDLSLDYVPGEDKSASKLVSIGPKSQVIPVGGIGDRNPGLVKELFAPDSCPKLEELELQNVTICGVTLEPDAIRRLIRIKQVGEDCCSGYGILTQFSI